MKHLHILIMALLVTLTACTSSRPQKVQLTKAEIKEFCSQQNLTLSDSLRHRLIADSKELHLTPEEMQVLKSTGKVVLCGKCGYILDSLKFKKHEQEEQEMKQHTRTKDGFKKDSLRQRIIFTYTN